VRPFRPRRRWGIGAQARSRRRSPLGEGLHRHQCPAVVRVACVGRDVCRVHGCLRGRHGAAAGWVFEGSNVHIAVCEQPQPNKRNGRAHVPAGTSQGIRSADAKPQRLSTRRNRSNGGGTALRRRAGCRVKDAPVPPHRVHHHSEFARQGARLKPTFSFSFSFAARCRSGRGSASPSRPRRAGRARACRRVARCARRSRPRPIGSPAS
jgi:hypothetical protein